MNIEETAADLARKGWWPPEGKRLDEPVQSGAIVGYDPDGPYTVGVWTWQGKFGAHDQMPGALPLCHVALRDVENGWLERTLWVLGIPGCEEAPRFLREYDAVAEGDPVDFRVGPREHVVDLATGTVMTAREALALLGDPALTNKEAAQRRAAEHMEVVRLLEAAYWQAEEVCIRLDGRPDVIVARGASEAGTIVLTLVSGPSGWSARVEGLGAALQKAWEPRYVLFVGHAAKLLLEERHRESITEGGLA